MPLSLRGSESQQDLHVAQSRLGINLRLLIPS
jgi:hypothetical protein